MATKNFLNGLYIHIYVNPYSILALKLYLYNTFSLSV